mmetsp:Transcript_43597/g.79426  ORF Transcript_43597/g.79426 Transcript_43597/m.79426 type:complete len:341 (-) Transcript_43597:246-1268(-)
MNAAVGPDHLVLCHPHKTSRCGMACLVPRRAPQQQSTTRGARGTFVALLAFAVAANKVCRQRLRRSCTNKLPAVPTDFYGLLGLPTFTGSREEVRSAFRRMVKLLHPDVLGSASKELTRLLTTAYKTLSNDQLRADYDKELMKVRPPAAGTTPRGGRRTKKYWHSTWPAGATYDDEGYFVDESQCVMCRNCVDIAPGTFALHGRGHTRAYVFKQNGDPADDLHWAKASCPTGAIFRGSREKVEELEEAMSVCPVDEPHVMMRKRVNWMGSRNQVTPFTVAVELRAGRELRSESAYRRHSRQAQCTSATEVAASIQAAVASIPSEISAKAWCAQDAVPHSA